MDCGIAHVEGNGIARHNTTANVVLPPAPKMAGRFRNLSMGVWQANGHY